MRIHSISFIYSFIIYSHLCVVFKTFHVLSCPICIETAVIFLIPYLEYADISADLIVHYICSYSLYIQMDYCLVNSVLTEEDG